MAQDILRSMKMENMLNRSKLLIEEFLSLTRNDRRQKIVCYPMLGAQKTLIGELARFGFKFVGIAVLRFMMNGTNSREILNLTELAELNSCYTLQPWSDEYFDYAVQVVREAFDTSADARFDPRVKTLEGTADILEKITKEENIKIEQSDMLTQIQELARMYGANATSVFEEMKKNPSSFALLSQQIATRKVNDLLLNSNKFKTKA